MGFDSTLDDLRSSGSPKWSDPKRPLQLWRAEMDFGTAPQIQQAVKEIIDGPGVGYLDPEQLDALREATAGFVARFGLDISPSQVSLAPDVVTIGKLLVTRLARPHERILMLTPGYKGFRHVIPLTGREVVEVPFADVDGRTTFDLAAIERELDAGVAVLILVNPANPTGRVYTREELTALDAVLSRYPATRVIADEIHAPFVMDGEHIPYATISSNAARQSITTTSASKGWNLAGYKAAQVIFTNPADLDTLAPVFAEDELALSTLGVVAQTVAYNECWHWQREALATIRANRDELSRRVATWPGVKLTPMEATYIAWLDFSGAYDAGRIPADVGAATHLEKFGVALTPGEEQGPGLERFARMMIAEPPAVFAEALERIESALGLK
ncbi:cystathionine beta-lyase [Arcanobacterium wilhelmae]|uniref:cysteine-S-conjugate beta-lyase n=1 Tax=Arcanobacterium wilhelmae TaxID=1803177 RepID=A0ABT9NEJ9_9ACTO|nr:aminotransferase class I/II-fold pyridoxal phosphate-dependent enzyme [Arcanobacterium wilhelmae]MDP9801606.1 cystathionine beta-lyase [Arcanobacterium wilhelmae]